MIHRMSPVAARKQWLKIRGVRILDPASAPCRIPPRASQIQSKTKPPSAVITHVISAAHRIPPFLPAASDPINKSAAAEIA